MEIPRADALELRDVSPTSPWTTINAASQLVSSRVGLIRNLGHGVYRAQDPVSLAMGAVAPDLSRFTDILNANKAGGGGESIERALASTMGEAVERYCMLFYDKSEMVLAPYREVRDNAVDPDTLRLYSRQQVDSKGPNVRLDYFTEDTRIRWVWGYSLTTKRPRLVPATLVFLQYELDEGEQSIGRNASSGLAAGGTLEEAILTGLYEVVERDAFATSWLHCKVGPRIVVDDPELEEAMRERFHYGHPKVNFRIFDITLDIPIPSAFAVMRRPSEFGPVVCVASVTRLSPRDLIRKCLSEVGQGLPYLRFLRHQFRNWQPASDFSDLRTFDHHCTLYVKRPELADEALAFLDGVTEEVPLSRIPDRSTGRVLGDIQRCLSLIEPLGYEVIVVDITAPEIRDVGLHVVRVLIPGLVPLHGNHSFPYLGVRRLHEIPDRLGWESSGWNPSAGINPYPHPFP